MKSKGVEVPYGVINEVGQGDKWTIAEFSGCLEIIGIKKCWQILPIPYEGIIHNYLEIIEHKLVMKGI